MIVCRAERQDKEQGNVVKTNEKVFMSSRYRSMERPQTITEQKAEITKKKQEVCAEINRR